MRLGINEVEDNVATLVKRESFNLEFIYELLLAYGKPPASITRLKKGTYNLAVDKSSEIYWKSNLYFKQVNHNNLHSEIDDLMSKPFTTRHNPRFIIVTNYTSLLALDTKEKDTLDIPINLMDKHFAFFLPWAGLEKKHHQTENIADVKAAERMAKLYDEVIKHTDSKDTMFYHGLNVFFSRLLFCFFAEDTEVFKKGQFTDSIASYTQEDGSDLDKFLDDLFMALDIDDKTGYPSHIREFPYVNGGLFNKTIKAPTFSRQARKLILECGELDWAQINPDIFGSMIQAVVHPGERAGLGMHYTSVVNIMKIIEPLFLGELKKELANSLDDQNKLKRLLQRIYSIKVFDPACGSGNFLIIAYKELRRLENDILEQLLKNKLGIKLNSGVKLENFYGIEIDDFAHEVAILSLWLAKHQMNIDFKTRFGKDIPLIPLKDTGFITCDNAARIDWEQVCRIAEDDEVYIIGNPPYGGARKQNKFQKDDMNYVFSRDLNKYKDLDYISIWFYKGSKFINGHRNAKLALVSTNSISQGEQVSLLWPSIFKMGIEIGFAYHSFKWTNNARGNAGVTVVIISLRSESSKEKYIYIGDRRAEVKNINAYLQDAKSDLIIFRQKNSIAGLPKMEFGNMPLDGGALTLTDSEAQQLLHENPEAKKFLRRMYGSEELIKDIRRWCLWITDTDRDEAEKIPEIKKRIQLTFKNRNESKDKGTNKKAKSPHQFREMKSAKSQALIIPRVSSENREYLPIAFLNNDSVISDSALAIYDPEPYIFGLISSKMHMVWTRAVGGQLETRIRYSAEIVYNNFPIPVLKQNQKQMITNHVIEVLDARGKHSEKTLSELYEPSNMPEDLKEAHRGLDEVIDLCYRSRPFENNDERLALLFKLYEIMSENNKELK